MAVTSRAPVFKAYTQDQPLLLPPSVDELIPMNHPVRVVNEVVGSLDLSCLVAGYEGGGTSSYHPAMLLKLVVYGYLRNVYSSRKLEESVRENIHFMWLSGGACPDHNTLARFRSQRLKEGIRDVFRQVVELLVAQGLVSLEEAYLDGTKFESSAGRYTFVWGRSIKTNKEKMRQRLNELLAYADKLEDAEVKSAPLEFGQVTPDAVKETARIINEKLKGKEVSPKVRAQVRNVVKTAEATLEKYERHEDVLGERNSFSKTDPDATFMRMKEDHMGNGQLKPAYNLQISTQNQFVLHFSIHQNPADTRTLKSHLEDFESDLGTLPKSLVADAGYGSLENYELLERKGVEAYIKDPRFNKDLHKEDPFHAANWREDKGSLICPAGRLLPLVSQAQDGTKNYAASDCSDCPLREKCCRGAGNRTASINPKLERLRVDARKRLISEKGVQMRKRRCHEPETVFGQIKQNKGFRRLSLKGVKKVQTELGILLLAHNLAKMAS